MFANETANRLFAAAFSVIFTVGTFAYAIIPGSPAVA